MAETTVGNRPGRFALVERSPGAKERPAEPGLEPVLTTGERLRISAGVDITTQRTAPDALRT